MSTSYRKILDSAGELIKSEGFVGAHSFIFLTRLASLNDDKALAVLVGNTLEDMHTLPANGALAYAYAEYFEAEKAGFCPAAAEYVLSRCSADDDMLFAALAKCAAAFGSTQYLEKSLALAENAENASEGYAYIGFGFLELYRATFNREYLAKAFEYADMAEREFHESFSPAKVYDIETPSESSVQAVLLDALSAVTGDRQLGEAAEKQRRFVAVLAEKYPTRVAFGLCALLGEEFGRKTVVCRVPEGELPEEVRSLLEFYSPVTEIILERDENLKKPEYYFMKNGRLEQIRGI